MYLPTGTVRCILTYHYHILDKSLRHFLVSELHRNTAEVLSRFCPVNSGRYIIGETAKRALLYLIGSSNAVRHLLESLKMHISLRVTIGTYWYTNSAFFFSIRQEGVICRNCCLPAPTQGKSKHHLHSNNIASHTNIFTLVCTTVHSINHSLRPSSHFLRPSSHPLRPSSQPLHPSSHSLQHLLPERVLLRRRDISSSNGSLSSKGLEEKKRLSADTSRLFRFSLPRLASR